MNCDFVMNKLSKNKINAALFYQNGVQVNEYYKNSKQKDKLHRLNSCTKSIISILFGIAYEKGLLSSLHISIEPFFPEIYAQLHDERKKDITIYHLLTMTDGLDFPEFDGWNYFSPMNYQTDMLKFVLERPIIHPIGEHMNYNSGCSHLLSAILQKITGMKTEEYAYKNLFEPLGIKEYRWNHDKQNINLGADGLYLKIEDMTKIGLLMLQDGVYNGKRILSSDWIKETTQPLNLTYESIGYYGLHWWVHNSEETFYFALGLGGQYIMVIPSKELVIAIVSHCYDDSLRPLRLIKKCIL